jgi:hypothetical protein
MECSRTKSLGEIHYQYQCLGMYVRESLGAKRKQDTHAHRVWLGACRAREGRSEEETVLCVLPVACPPRDLWRNPILTVRIGGLEFGTGFNNLMKRIYIYFHSWTQNRQRLSAKGFKSDSSI